MRLPSARAAAEGLLTLGSVSAGGTWSAASSDVVAGNAVFRVDCEESFFTCAEVVFLERAMGARKNSARRKRERTGGKVEIN